MQSATNHLMNGNLLEAIKEYESIISSIQITDYMFPTCTENNPSKSELIEIFCNMGTIYRNIFEKEQTVESFQKSIMNFISALKIDTENEYAQNGIIIIYTQICSLVQNNTELTIQYLLEALNIVPTNYTLHYNLGHMYQKNNEIIKSSFHYKLAVKLCESELANLKQSKKSVERDAYKQIEELLVNSFNGLGCLYRGIHLWIESLFYLLKAKNIYNNDPDINNQLGIVYTEMRDTNTAKKCYEIAINHYKESFITIGDKEPFLSEIYLNMGHMYSYNGQNEDSIKCYNKALGINPRFRLPFQNKLMNLIYIFDNLDEKMYITRQHKLINKILIKGNEKFKEKAHYKHISIGLISGDFVDHPVSWFIKGLLESHSDKFKFICYSQTNGKQPVLQQGDEYKLIKNKDTKNVVKMIRSDKIHILLDLSGHTAGNRIDVFAWRAAPIQISCIGYPFTTGIDNMDYRITDRICDNEEISRHYYTEKLLYMPNCFLNYTPPESLPELSSEFNGYTLKIGCFNRLNKITEGMIKLFNRILEEIPNSVIVFKTKALLNIQVKNEFIKKFIDTARIIVLVCTVLHEDHLKTYNQIDIAIDTFPYSGTTTSCEALSMGVPVLSIHDSTNWFHPQNVTCSILANSGLSEFICVNNDGLILKLKELKKNIPNKNSIRNSFLNGLVCDKNKYVANFEKLLVDTL